MALRWSSHTSSIWCNVWRAANIIAQLAKRERGLISSACQ